MSEYKSARAISPTVHDNNCGVNGLAPAMFGVQTVMNLNLSECN